MKKTRNNFLAAILGIAGLSVCMLSGAEAENVAFSSANLSLMQSESIGALPSSSLLASAPVVSPVTGSPNAFNAPAGGYKFNNSLNLPSTPSYSLPLTTVTPNSVIPEPTSAACLLLGLGVLVGFRYLKVRRQTN